MESVERQSPNLPAPITLYGAAGSGSIAVEAALTLLGIPYSLVEGATWVEAPARDRIAPQNPMRQVPTLVFPGGEVMTESAAILIALAEAHPNARLCPTAPGQQRRPALDGLCVFGDLLAALDQARREAHRRTARAA